MINDNLCFTNILVKVDIVQGIRSLLLSAELFSNVLVHPRSRTIFERFQRIYFILECSNKHTSKRNNI